MSVSIEILLQTLTDGDEASRINAVLTLGNIPISSDQVVRALEQVVISDPSEHVQEVALEALAMPVHHHIQRRSVGIYSGRDPRAMILSCINEWTKDGLLTSRASAVLRGRYDLAPAKTSQQAPVQPQESPAPAKTAEQAFDGKGTHDTPTTPKKPAAEIPPKSLLNTPTPTDVFDEFLYGSTKKPETTSPPKSAAATVKSQRTQVFYDGEIMGDHPVKPELPILEKHKFSLLGTLTSEVTINISLYLGAFLIVAAAVVFAGLYEPARFPMLTLTLLGFLGGAVVTVQRIPLGSFVLFVIGTLLIPIDAALLIDLMNNEASLFYWAAVAGGVSLVWAAGTYFYESRFLSLLVFATFSISAYLVAFSYVSVDSTEFLLVVGLMALAGLGEAAYLRGWKGDEFFVPMFGVAQLQALGVLSILGVLMLAQVADLLARIAGRGDLAVFDAARLGTWLTLGIFYFASDHLTRQVKKWNIPAFRMMVTACLIIPPIFIMEAMSADSHQIAAVLWGWGVLGVVAAEAFSVAPVRWRRTYADLFLVTALAFLIAAPVVEYVTTREYAIGYLMATSLVCLGLSYRRREAAFWAVALFIAYVAYLVGVQVLSEQASSVFPGFALLISALVFMSIELGARRYFRASAAWAQPPLWLGLFNIVWDVGLLLSWYDTAHGSAAIPLLIYGIFGVLYAMLDNQRERGQALMAWIAGLVAFYGAYLHILPHIEQIEFGGYMLLVPALVFISAEFVGKRYFRAAPIWTQPLLLLGLLNLGLDIWVTLEGGQEKYAASAALIFLIYGLFGIGYTRLNVRIRRDYAVTAWVAGLVALYAAYIFGSQLQVFQDMDIFQGFVLLLPALVYLSAELAGKHYFGASHAWTLPLLGLGLWNAALVVLITMTGGQEGYSESAALVFLIYGVFGALYALIDARAERNSAAFAWTVGVIALYAAYLFYRLPVIEQLDISTGFVLLLPALVFLSAELAGKHYFQFSTIWTQPLLALGVLNAVLVVPITLVGGLNNAFDGATLIFLIYGVFGVLYAALDARTERAYAAYAWTVGMIALYAAYLFYRLPVIEQLDNSLGFVLLLPALVFLSAELAGKLYFQFSTLWTRPLLALGVWNAVLVVPVTLISGLDSYPGSAALIFLIYGLFGVLYTTLNIQAQRDHAVIAWTAGLIAIYAAYGFGYLFYLLDHAEVFLGFVLLLPTLIFLSGELVGKLYFRVSKEWTLPLLYLGLFNAVLLVPITFADGLDNRLNAAIVFLIYGLFAMLYTRFTVRTERDFAVVAWVVGLITLYMAYGFGYGAIPKQIVVIIFLIYGLFAVLNTRLSGQTERGYGAIALAGGMLLAIYIAYGYGLIPIRVEFKVGYAVLIPAIVYLSGELAGKRYFRVSQAWTLPLFGLGLFSAILLVPITLNGGLEHYPSDAAIIFLLFGLFAVTYARLMAQLERDKAIIAWTVGLIAFYIAYCFGYRTFYIHDYRIFPGYVLLLPALVYLSADLAGRRYFRASREWTLPLLGLGLMNAALVVPVTLDGGLNDYPGSAALICLIYGLAAATYTLLSNRSKFGYVATISIAIALAFALLFYDEQEQWVLPFVLLAVFYYLGSLVAEHLYHQRDWSAVLWWSGLPLGTAMALSAPYQGGDSAVLGMGLVATMYGAEGFRWQNIWLGLPANALFLGAYFLALQERNVTEPQFYSIGTGLLAVVTHYLLTRRSEDRAVFVIGFATGVSAQLILLGTSFMQMDQGFQFFFILFFQSLILLGYGLVTRSLSFTIIPIIFVVCGVLRVVFTVLADYSTVVTLGCTGLSLVLLGITALVMRERLLKTYEQFQQLET